jgi:hypothetical protein
VTLPRVALALLGVLAVVFGVNLVSATSRFVSAWDAYDSVRIELADLVYTRPDEPVYATAVITNPSGVSIDIRAIELRLDAGIRRVGGGELRPARPATADDAARFTLDPGESQAFVVTLNIDDEDYVERLGTSEIDWRVSGRVQVKFEKDLDERWVTT